MEPAFSILHLQETTTCPYPEPDQSSPCLHPISWKSTLILRFHLHQGIPSGLFPSVLPTKLQYAPLLSPMPAICPDNSLFLLWSSERFSEKNKYHTAPRHVAFSTPPVTSSLLGLNIFLSTLFSNTLSLCSSLNVRGKFHTPAKQLSHFFMF